MKETQRLIIEILTTLNERGQYPTVWEVQQTQASIDKLKNLFEVDGISSDA